jgi:nucleolar protein 58
MIVQAICIYYFIQLFYFSLLLNLALLDDLDKETNNYIMRCKEWYGWHFPELAKIIQDNIAFCKTVLKIGKEILFKKNKTIIYLFMLGYRTNAAELDLSDILPADVEAQVKEAAEISMGTEISEEDITNIRHLCAQVCLVELIKSYRSHVRI